MKLTSLIGAVLAMGLAAPADAQPAPAAQVEKIGLYVVADDLGRAGEFYTALFGVEPRVRTPGMLGYDVAGGFYAIVSKAAYAPGATRGTTVAPYLRVKDVHRELERVRRLAPDRLQTNSVVVEGPFRFFRFTDVDDNLIEFYSVAAPD